MKNAGFMKARYSINISEITACRGRYGDLSHQKMLLYGRKPKEYSYERNISFHSVSSQDYKSDCSAISGNAVLKKCLFPIRMFTTDIVRKRR